VRWWKVVGLAAFVGVAATGVAIARSERRRRAYTPQEIRARLHARLAEAGTAETETPETGVSEAGTVGTGSAAPD
jgi:hypothetical protein